MHSVLTAFFLGENQQKAAKKVSLFNHLYYNVTMLKTALKTDNVVKGKKTAKKVKQWVF